MFMYVSICLYDMYIDVDTYIRCYIELLVYKINTCLRYDALYLQVYMLFIKGMDVVNSPLHFCWDWVWSSIGPKPPWQTAPGKVPQEACGRVDEQQVYSFHLASRVKRWMTRRTYSHLDAKRHIYIWLILCGYVSVAAPKQLLGIFTPRKWEKRLRKLRNFSQQNSGRRCCGHHCRGPFQCC